MLARLIARNPDLERLVNEGYELALSASNNHLLISHVPHVTSAREVAYGTLVTVIAPAGDVINAPADHVVMFIGTYPCDADGNEIKGMFNSNDQRSIDTGLVIDRTFSARPAQPYTNYYDKMTKYVAMLEGHAQVLDPTATARTHRPYAMSEAESVYRYADTSSSRAGIAALNAKLEMPRVAIVGLGGTGSYLLDFLAKTPIKEIHLFDDDVFVTHNAFRAPGAPSREQLEERKKKVKYLEAIYDRMRRGIVVHEEAAGEVNLADLATMSFVFLCMDSGPTKKLIIDALVDGGVPLIDAGIGVQVVDGRLCGLVRTTLITPGKHDHVAETISLGDGNINDEYGRNIQIAELNALNASLAVIRWKKFCEYYADEAREHSSFYKITTNGMMNEKAA